MSICASICIAKRLIMLLMSHLPARCNASSDRRIEPRRSERTFFRPRRGMIRGMRHGTAARPSSPTCLHKRRGRRGKKHVLACVYAARTYPALHRGHYYGHNADTYMRATRDAYTRARAHFPYFLRVHRAYLRFSRGIRAFFLHVQRGREPRKIRLRLFSPLRPIRREYPHDFRNPRLRGVNVGADWRNIT